MYFSIFVKKKNYSKNTINCDYFSQLKSKKILKPIFKKNSKRKI